MMNEGGSDKKERDRKLFDSIAHHYVRKDLLPAQIAARRCRLRQTISRVENPQKQKFLEVGCGAGFAAKYLDGLYAEYLGIDYSSELISLAENFNSDKNVRFIALDIDEFETIELFDVVFMIGLLHHLVDPVSSLARITRFVSPGGWIVANEPQSGNPAITVARKIRKLIDPAYSADQKEFSRKEILKIFEQSGLEQISIFPQGIFSPPFAEVAMPAQAVFAPLSKFACIVDVSLENLFPKLLNRIAWNLVAVGRKN